VAAEQEAAEARDYRVSGRLGAEFHITLGELSGNPLLLRYLSEVVSRCALILAVHGHDHDQRRSIAEHLELIELLNARDADGAERIVADHVLAVEERALARGSDPGPIDLAEVLNRY
jgi:DNA-binding GntR family transcriptional regulator